MWVDSNSAIMCVKLVRIFLFFSFNFSSSSSPELIRFSTNMIALSSCLVNIGSVQAVLHWNHYSETLKAAFSICTSLHRIRKSFFRNSLGKPIIGPTPNWLSLMDTIIWFSWMAFYMLWARCLRIVCVPYSHSCIEKESHNKGWILTTYIQMPYSWFRTI